MHLANPLALWLLPLLATPLLLTRRRTPTVQLSVSNLYLWRQAVVRNTQNLAFRRIRRSWLTALQMVSIGAVVLALSEPVLTLAGGRTTMIFDVSSSMSAREDGTTRFDVARQRALAFLRTLPPTSPVRLIAAAGSPRSVGTYAAADPRLSAAVAALEPTSGGADVPGAIAVAAGSGDRESIVVFSDEELSPGQSESRPPIEWVKVGHVAENAAVVGVAARHMWLGTPAGQVMVVLKNFGARPRTAEVEISVDDHLVSRVSAGLPATGLKTLSVMVPDVGQIVTARLKGNDALQADDVRSALVQLARPIRVVLLGPRGSYLEKALRANPSVSLVTRDPRDADGTRATPDTGNADVLVCDGCDVGGAATLPMLVVAPPGKDSAQGPVTRVSGTHPVATALEFDEQTAMTVRTTPVRNAEVLLRVGGFPAVTASDDEGLRRVDVQLDLTREDFALTAAFPVLIANALEWLAAEHGVPAEIVAGQPLAIALPEGSGTDAVRVIGPDDLPRDVQRAGRRFIATDTDLAGIYRVSLNGSEHVVVASPLTDGESDLMTSVGASDRQNEMALPTAVGEPHALSAWLLLLALVCVTLEWRLRLVSAP